MNQLEFGFMATRYDIFTDRYRPVSHEEVRVLWAVYRAYEQVRHAINGQPLPANVAMRLADIHNDLMRVVHREPDRSE